MKHSMIRKAGIAVLCIGTIALMAGCTGYSTESSVTYHIQNGDDITVTVDTTEGYQLNDEGEGSFSITYGSNDLVAEGSFKLGDDDSWGILIDDLNNYGAQLLDGNVDDGLFVAYIPEYDEYDYVEYIEGSETVVVMTASTEQDIYDAINVTGFSAN